MNKAKNAFKQGKVPCSSEEARVWKFYDDLIAGIPEDLEVLDYCLGTRWSYLEASCGTGISYTCKGGAKRRCKADLRGLTLKSVAELSKSWCFEEASLGVAALNAYYAQSPLLETLSKSMSTSLIENLSPGDSSPRMNAFEYFRPQSEGKKVTVVGHFPHVGKIAEYAQLTVLERNCSDDLDTPDPACEYILPLQDFVFITGVTIINKTAPRLLCLAQKARTIMVGPSVVPSSILFDWGVEALAGSVVVDPDKVRFVVKSGAGPLFEEALQMTMLVRPK